MINNNDYLTKVSLFLKFNIFIFILRLISLIIEILVVGPTNFLVIFNIIFCFILAYNIPSLCYRKTSKKFYDNLMIISGFVGIVVSADQFFIPCVSNDPEFTCNYFYIRIYMSGIIFFGLSLFSNICEYFLKNEKNPFKKRPYISRCVLTFFHSIFYVYISITISQKMNFICK